MRALVLCVLALVSCKQRGAERWIGIDRASAACATERDGNLFPDHATCVEAGRFFRCVHESGAWQCAEVRERHPEAEQP